MQKNTKNKKWKKQDKNNKFFTKLKKEPIKIKTRSAPQNDCLYFNFVKDIHVIFKNG